MKVVARVALVICRASGRAGVGVEVPCLPLSYRILNQNSDLLGSENST